MKIIQHLICIDKPNNLSCVTSIYKTDQETIKSFMELWTHNQQVVCSSYAHKVLDVITAAIYFFYTIKSNLNIESNYWNKVLHTSHIISKYLVFVTYNIIRLQRSKSQKYIYTYIQIQCIPSTAIVQYNTVYTQCSVTVL